MPSHSSAKMGTVSQSRSGGGRSLGYTNSVLVEMLDQKGANELKDIFERSTTRYVRANAPQVENFAHFVVQTRNDGSQDAIKLGSYSEEELYGLISSPVVRFRGALRGVVARSKCVLSQKYGSLEFEYEATLLFSDVSNLSVYLCVSDEINEIVANLRIVAAQCFKSLATPPIIEALQRFCSALLDASRWDSQLIDAALDQLEQCGIDLNFPTTFEHDDREESD